MFVCLPACRRGIISVMKKKYLIPLLALLVVSGVASAQTTGSTNTTQRSTLQAKREATREQIETKRADIDAMRESKRLEMEAKRAEIKAKRVEFQQDIAQRKVENASRVISATIDKLENLVTRVESRISKLEANGGDTTASKSHIALAKGSILKARAAVEAFASIELTSDKARDNYEKIRVAAAEVREHIRTAHRELMQAVRLLGQVQSSLRTAPSTSSGQATSTDTLN